VGSNLDQAELARAFDPKRRATAQGPGPRAPTAGPKKLRKSQNHDSSPEWSRVERGIRVLNKRSPFAGAGTSAACDSFRGAAQTGACLRIVA